MNAKWLVRNKSASEEWLIDVQDGRVVLTQCRGAFGLPVAQVTIAGSCAATVAKSIREAGQLTKPKRTAKGKSPSLEESK